ncbi:MAG: copper amine oxidase N-terminal domain-containing protein [Ruminococcaceae bacterium]|nr:copper amine oxidase N-terminal domain-containing protein [Oscillospiraceae bacterium]
MKKKIFALVMATMFLLLSTVAVGAESEQTTYLVVDKPITVTYNGDAIVFPDALPLIEAERTLVPIRAILERAELTVNFDAESRLVTAEKDGLLISMPIDSAEATVFAGDTSKTVTLEAPATIIDDRTYVPIRFIAESLGAKVNWNPNGREVVIIDIAEWKAEIAENSEFFSMLLDTPLAQSPQAGDTTGSYNISVTMKNDLVPRYKNTIDISIDFTATEVFDGANTGSNLILEADLRDLASLPAEDEEELAMMDVYAKKHRIDLDMVVDEDWNLYLKSKAIVQILRDSGQERIADNIGDKYVKLSLRDVLGALLHLQVDFEELIAKSNTLGELLENLIIEDDMLYSQSVYLIDSYISQYISIYSNDFFTKTEKKDGSVHWSYALDSDAYLNMVLDMSLKDVAKEEAEAVREALQETLEGMDMTLHMDYVMKDGIATRAEAVMSNTTIAANSIHPEETTETKLDMQVSTAVRPFDKRMDKKVGIPTKFVELDEILGFPLAEYFNLLLIG